jgi:hypothetical protein
VSLPEEQRRFLIETYRPGVAIPSDPRAQQKQLQIIVRKTTDPITLLRMENDFSRPLPSSTPVPTPTVHERQKALIGKIVSLSDEQRRFLIETYEPGVPIPSDPTAQQKRLQIIVRKTADPITLSRMENDFSN